MNDDLYDVGRWLPSQISDETAVVLCDFLEALALAVERRYFVQRRRYYDSHGPSVDPERPWRNINSN